jgi:hypothetical protein
MIVTVGLFGKTQTVAPLAAASEPPFDCRVDVNCPSSMALVKLSFICEKPSWTSKYCILSMSNDTEYTTDTVDRVDLPRRAVNRRLTSVVVSTVVLNSALNELSATRLALTVATTASDVTSLLIWADEIPNKDCKTTKLRNTKKESLNKT